MKFVELMKKIQHNTPIEIYYNDCTYVNDGTAEQIKKMYAWNFFLYNKDIESIEINKETKALMITLIKE